MFRRLGPIAFALALAPLLISPPGASAAAGSYVALGDSYSSGVGTGESISTKEDRITRTATGVKIGGKFFASNPTNNLAVKSVVLEDGTPAAIYSADRSVGEGEPLLSAVARSKQVTLTWGPVPHAIRYVISRDGQTLGATSSTSWLDSEAAAGTTHRYFVIAHTTETFKPHTSTKTAPIADERFPRSTKTLFLTVETPSVDSLAGAKNALSARIEASLVPGVQRYNLQSFIADESVAGFPCEEFGSRFAGDNRTFFTNPLVAIESGQFRLNQTVRISWPDAKGPSGTFSPPTITQSVRAGTTNKVDEFGEIVDSRQASVEWMEMDVATISNSFTRIYVTQAGADPYCDEGGPNIQGILTYLDLALAHPIYGAGSFSGSGRPVPHQQLDYWDDLGLVQLGWRPVWRAESTSFACLVAAACEFRNIDYMEGF